MIQFNLLPDVKLEYIKARRLKELLTGISILVSAGTVLVALVLFVGVNISQKNKMNNLNKQITSAAAKVSATKNLDQLITVQNQLVSLPKIHADKPAATRLFGYLSQTTPKDVTISSVTVDLVGGLITLNGQANNLFAVNTYVDTLKFTKFTDKPDGAASASDPTLAFKSVLLAGFSTDDKKATYQITMGFDPLLFKNEHVITLVVPSITTTRSQQDQPSVLFEQPATPKKAGAQ